MKIVQGTVEDPLNALLDAEADEMCKAQRMNALPIRSLFIRAGHYRRKLHTKAGEVEVKVLKLRKQTFETAIIKRYQKPSLSE